MTKFKLLAKFRESRPPVVIIMSMLFPIGGLANLFEAAILFMNAMAILNERYFLRHCSIV